MRRQLATVAFLLIATTAHAGGVACKKLMWEPGKTYDIYSAMDQTTHIILPERIQGKPIIGNRELWNLDFAGSHVFVQPNSTEPKGSVTTLTVITESDASYDFSIRRSMAAMDTCVQIVEGKILDPEQRKALDQLSGGAAGVGGGSSPLKQRMEEMEARHKDDVEKAVSEAVRKYRYHIYTRYDWDTGSGFIGKNLISDVYDDGRFTYIRLSNDNKGLLTVEATLADHKEFVEAKYDDVSKIYKVVGIYPKFKMSYDNTSVEITRQDNTTQGNY